MFQPSQWVIIRPYKKWLQFHKIYVYLTGSHLVTFTVWLYWVGLCEVVWISQVDVVRFWCGVLLECMCLVERIHTCYTLYCRSTRVCYLGHRLYVYIIYIYVYIIYSTYVYVPPGTCTPVILHIITALTSTWNIHTTSHSPTQYNHNENVTKWDPVR
jgi:hypothetical protein